MGDVQNKRHILHWLVRNLEFVKGFVISSVWQSYGPVNGSVVSQERRAEWSDCRVL